LRKHLVLSELYQVPNGFKASVYAIALVRLTAVLIQNIKKNDFF
jgi:hypothetical protein